MILTITSTLELQPSSPYFFAIEETLLLLDVWKMDTQPLGMGKRRGREGEAWRRERRVLISQNPILQTLRDLSLYIDPSLIQIKN